MRRRRRRRLDVVRRRAVDGEGDDAAAPLAQVVDGHAGQRASSLAQRVGQRRRRAPRWPSQAPARARSRPPRPGRSCRRRCVSQFSKRRASGAQLVAVAAPSRRPRAGRGTAARGARAAPGGRRGSPMPRGPRRNLRPVADEHVAADLARRRPAAGRPTGRRRADRARRPRAPPAPTRAAGLTSPPLVGTWVMAISLTRSSSIVAQRRRPRAGRARRRGRPRRPRRCGAATCRKAMIVAGVLGAARSGCGRPARSEQRVEGHVPGARGVLDDGDLVAARSRCSARDRVVDALDRRVGRGRRPRSRRSRASQLQVADDGVEHRLRASAPRRRC